MLMLQRILNAAHVATDNETKQVLERFRAGIQNTKINCVPPVGLPSPRYLSTFSLFYKSSISPRGREVVDL